jgi:uncharacterized protein YkwD
MSCGTPPRRLIIGRLRLLAAAGLAAPSVVCAAADPDQALAFSCTDANTRPADSSHAAVARATFVARIRRSGYLRGTRRWRVRENLAWGSHTKQSPRAIVYAWMHSPPHRKEILTPSYRDVGLGVARGLPSSPPAGGATYTADFGVRR